MVYVSIRFRWRMAEEGTEGGHPCLQTRVSIRFRWRMAEEDATDGSTIKSVHVSIRFRWRMAEEDGFRGQGSGGQLFKPNISPQIFSLKS